MIAFLKKDTFYRDAYIQRREYQINDGQIDDEEIFFDDFD